MIINNINEEVPFGNFIIPKPDNEEVKEKTSFIGYDYMIKFDIPYKSRVTYPCKAKVLFQDVCNQVGLVAGNIEFVNCDYMILGNPFTNNETCRVVLSNLAQLAGGFAKIGRDNKPYIISLDKSNTVETIDGNNYFTDFSKNKQWGELNSLILRISGTEGENTTKEDNESVVQNGLTELVIEDNYFLIDQVEREKVINPLWNKLKGLKYLPFKTDYYGYPYLDSGDKIKVLDSKDNEFETYVFNHTFTFNGSYSGKLETTALTKTQTAYKNKDTTKVKFRQVERKINKIDGIIEDVIEEQSEYNHKISQAIQTLDELRSSISDIADLTVSAENYNAKVILENINESEPIRVVVRPVGEDISYLYPRDNLYPSDDLYLKNRRIRFATDTYSTEWELPDDLLYYDAENYDELILDYEGQSCIINKKVEYNADGSKKLLDKPITVEYPYPKIELKDGDYTVSLLGYNTGYLFVRLMSQNIYTTQFATKAEVNSQIKQTTQDINLGVNEKLKNYSTTQETNSAINLKANEIKEEVSNQYATQDSLEEERSQRIQTATQINQTVSKKVGEDEIISKINQSAEKISINADKIDIDGKAVHFKTELFKTIGPFTKQDFDKVVDYVRNGTGLTVKEFEKYDLDGDGEIHLIDAQIIVMAINNGGYYTFSGTYEIDPYSTSKSIALRNSEGEYQAIISLMYNFFNWLNVGVLESSSNNGNVTTSISSGYASFNDLELNNDISIGVSRGEDRRTPSIELYKNDNGQKTLSLSPEEITIQWGHVLASHNLYNNTSGSTGTITLSESSANFSYLEIFYGKNQSTLHSVKVVNPNGKRACLTLAFYDIANSFVQMQVPKAIISGTTIMKEATGGANIYSGNTEAFTANEVAIFKVVGYK